MGRAKSRHTEQNPAERKPAHRTEKQFKEQSEERFAEKSRKMRNACAENRTPRIDPKSGAKAEPKPEQKSARGKETCRKQGYCSMQKYIKQHPRRLSAVMVLIFFFCSHAAAYMALGFIVFQNGFYFGSQAGIDLQKSLSDVFMYCGFGDSEFFCGSSDCRA